MTWATVTQALPQYQRPRARLGVTSDKRHAALPNVPTFREQEFDLLAMEWYGLLAPAARRSRHRQAQRRDEAYSGAAAGRARGGDRPVGSSPEELGSFLRSEIDRWTPVIKKLGLKAE